MLCSCVQLRGDLSFLFWPPAAILDFLSGTTNQNKLFPRQVAFGHGNLSQQQEGDQDMVLLKALWPGVVAVVSVFLGDSWGGAVV